jgi:hypothetical protein
MEENAALQKACRIGDMKLLKAALTSSPEQLNVQDSKLGWTPLYRSVICGHYEVAKYLLEQGAEANFATSRKETSLHQAAENNQLQIAKALLEAGADPNAQQSEGETPLHLAAFKGYERMVELLLKHGANPNLISENLGQTPLHYAVDNNHLVVASALLTRNLTSIIADYHGRRPQDLVRSEAMHSLLAAAFKSQLTEEVKTDQALPILSTSFDSSSITPTKLPQPAKKAPSIRPRALASEIEGVYEPAKDFKVYEAKLKELKQLNRSLKEYVKTSYNAIKQDYPLDESLDEQASSQLLDWLTSARLEMIYEALVRAGFDDIDHMRAQMRSATPIDEAMLVEIGLHKVGHRLRLLARLDDEVRMPLLSTSGVFRRDPIRCCGMSTRPHQVIPALSQWLASMNLESLASLFIESGLDDIEANLYLMTTNYPITEQVLADIGVVKPGYRIRLLARLRHDSPNLTRRGQMALRGIEMEGEERTSVCESCRVM